MNVHEFDGKWSLQLESIPVSIKTVMFNRLLSFIKDGDTNGVNGIHLVVSDTQNSSNYDTINKIYADDILAHICLRLNNVDHKILESTLFLLIEQMSDMYLTGRCPQGRTTRLLQVYNQLVD